MPCDVLLIRQTTQCLQELKIRSTHKLAAGDAIHLTSLTGLSSLSLEDAGPAVGEFTSVALACSLTNLRYLNLRCCRLDGMVCIPATAKLTGLTMLDLQTERDTPVLQEQQLSMLSSLTNLSCLWVTGVPAEAVKRFRAALRQQQKCTVYCSSNCQR